jgi:hypothetical protein
MCSEKYIAYLWSTAAQTVDTHVVCQCWKKLKVLFDITVTTCQCKMAGIRFHSFVANISPIARFAMTGITPWQTALKCTADCHNKNNPLAICTHILILLTVAICNMTIFFVTIRGTHLRAVCHNRVKSNTSHFTSTVPPPVHSAVSFWCVTLQV